MAEDAPRIEIPLPAAAPTEKMVFLQEQLVNFLRQYEMPLIEVSLVLSKYTRSLCQALEEQASTKGEVVPQILAEPWPLLGHESRDGTESGANLETLLDHLDEDRMDILDTILRTSMTATEMAFTDALMQLRQWEHLVRSQLAEARSTGQLYSPLEIPENW